VTPGQAGLPDFSNSLVSGVLRVAVGGETVVEQCTGTTGGSGTAACTPGARFQIASISKQFTAAAVLALGQRGALDPSDLITRWFPGGPHGWQDITVHHLLCHTSGLGHWEDFPEIDIRAPVSDRDLRAAVRERPLLHRPGSRFYYSSLGYCLLAQIVQETAGCGYAEFVGRALLEPAGLADSFAGSAGDRPDVALGHSGGESAPGYELDHTGQGAGDLYSTVGDLDRWNRALTGGLLGEPYRRMMFTGHAAFGEHQELGSGGSYGYGWFLARLGALELRYHTGHNAGFNSVSAWLPGPDLSVVALTNDDSSDVLTIARTLLADVPRLLVDDG
jgi:CubicO group peptidase (beta-lactamase class C family)